MSEEYKIEIKTNLTNALWCKNFKNRLWKDYKSTYGTTRKIIMGYIKELEERCAYNTMNVKSPTLNEIREYAAEKEYTFDIKDFFYYYEAKNWSIGGEKIAKWQALADRWNANSEKSKSAPSTAAEAEKMTIETLRLRRGKAIAAAEKNRAVAYANAEFNVVQKQIADLMFEAAAAGKSTATSAAIKRLTAKQNKILKSLNLTIEDLEPKYFCEFCCDTGFINGKKCECFKKIFNEMLEK